MMCFGLYSSLYHPSISEFFRVFPKAIKVNFPQKTDKLSFHKLENIMCECNLNTTEVKLGNVIDFSVPEEVQF